jgi:hypothetical protein
MPNVGEGFFQVKDKTTVVPGLHNEVIDVDLQVAPNLSLEVGLHTPLVGVPRVL